MKCIAVDDEPIALQVIQNHAARVPFLQLSEVFTNAFDAIEYLNLETVDLIFLDINMPDITGIEFYNSLRRKPLLIFTTAYADYALKGFELDAVDYLLKPFSLARFVQACNKALERHRYGREEQEPDFLFIKSGTEQHRVAYSEILWAEATGNYVSFQLSERKILSRMTMAEAEKLLPPRQFLRVHRSYIVAIGKITRIDRAAVFIQQHEIPVAEAYAPQLASITGGR